MVVFFAFSAGTIRRVIQEITIPVILLDLIILCIVRIFSDENNSSASQLWRRDIHLILYNVHNQNKYLSRLPSENTDNISPGKHVMSVFAYVIFSHKQVACVE